MKILMIVLAGLMVGCASSKKEEKAKEPTAAEQVEGLKKMCEKAAPTIKKRQEKKSLYVRLGKRKKIGTFAQKLYDSHKGNEKIGHMFAKVPEKPFVKNVTDFLVLGTGGKGKYNGKSMATVHKGLKISNADFLAAGGDVQQVMKEMKYGEDEVQEVVCALVSFVPVVVEVQ